MFSQHSIIALITGILAGGIFAAASSSASGGVLLLYLPCFFLMMLGFAYGAKQTAFAGLSAALTICLLNNTGDGIFFAGFIALPAWYFVHKALLWREKDGAHEWYPTLKILTDFTIILAMLFIVFAYATTHSGQNSIHTLIAHELSTIPPGTDPQIITMLKKFTEEWSFLIFALAGWWWVMMLYGFAVLANHFLTSRYLSLRPSLAISAHGLPGGLLMLAALSAVLAFIGQGNQRFDGQVLFLLLLLPYFLSGLALLHQTSHNWRNREIWLCLFYGALLFLPWVSIIAIAAGFYTQIVEILDKHRGIG